jgi:hypothetical protein
MPCYVMQTCLPVLLGLGLMDGLRVRQPVTAWMLFPDADGYPSSIIERTPDLPGRIRELVEAKMKDTLDTYVSLTKVMEDPSLAMMMLPLGVYVRFQYRCGIDSVAALLIGLAEIKVAGVPEFQFAMAQALAEVLQETGDVIDAASIPQSSP